jgi:hypothetical protein
MMKRGFTEALRVTTDILLVMLLQIISKRRVIVLRKYKKY